MKRLPLLRLAVGCLLLLTCVSVQAQDELRTRILSIIASPRQDPPPGLIDYIGALELVEQAGVNGNNNTAMWSALEPSAGNYQLDDWVNGINFQANHYGETLLLTLQPLNTVAKETPADLLGVPFDDPRMTQRFHALIDALLPHLDEHVQYLSIGNEVDVYLAAHPDEWAAYKTFYDDTLAYVHTIAPWIKVGVTSTYGGAHEHEAEIADLNASSDVFILTYYPLQPDFSVQSPNSPLTDFPRMVEMAGSLPVILQEVGYPSSSLLDSSEQAQAEFVANVYAAWANEGDHIPYLNFFLLHDLNDETCSELTQYYGLPNVQNFYEYLCTLGFRKADGTPKLAWQAFVDGAAQMDFS